MGKKIIVIYHSADFDGIFCREIARKFLIGAELIGWDYGQPTPCIPPPNEDGTPEVELYMLDISVEGLMDYPGLIWIDHHKSAMEKYGAKAGYQIDGVAACRLAWQWFSRPDCGICKGNGFVDVEKNDHVEQDDCGFCSTSGKEPLPTKEEFTHRKVTEPLAVRLAGEYDIWDKRDPRAELFQHGLRSQPLDSNLWRWMLGTDCDESMMTSSVESLLKQGESLQYARTQENASIITAAGFTIQFEGLTFLACNHARFNSHLFTAGLKPEHDACLGFCWDGQQWKVSLYHAPGKESNDLSLIAVKHGGGGHRGACGFRTKSLPFLT